MSDDEAKRRERAAAFVEAFGRTWQAWDVDGFVGLFSDEAVFADYPTTRTISGTEGLRAYLVREAEEQGKVTVRMGKPLVDGNQVAAEFWVAMADPGGGPADLVGSFVAQLDPADGRCTRLREYWFEIPGNVTPYDGWGE